MKYYDLHETYKDLYFHELDVREKLVNRIQLTFAFHVTIITVIAYMLRTVDFDSSIVLINVFFVSISISFLFLARSFYDAVRSFWGNEYKALPTPNEIENYRISTIKHEQALDEYRKINPENEEIEDYSAKDKLNEYLYNIYSDCASHNTNINDTRSKRIHSSIKYILFVSVPLLISISCFIFGDMDASSPRKKASMEYHKIESKLTDLTNTIIQHAKSEKPMSQQNKTPPQPKPTPQQQPKPPKAPSPPQPRNIIQDNTPKVKD